MSGLGQHETAARISPTATGSDPSNRHFQVAIRSGENAPSIDDAWQVDLDYLMVQISADAFDMIG